jgi:hypothetical protein
LSTENDTGIPARAWPDDVVAVAVAVTFSEPSFWMVAELSDNTRFDALAHPVAPDAADAPEQPPLPNGELPAFLPPPQAATREMLITAKAHFKVFITVSLGIG